MGPGDSLRGCGTRRQLKRLWDQETAYEPIIIIIITIIIIIIIITITITMAIIIIVVAVDVIVVVVIVVVAVTFVVAVVAHAISPTGLSLSLSLSLSLAPYVLRWFLSRGLATIVGLIVGPDVGTRRAEDDDSSAWFCGGRGRFGTVVAGPRRSRGNGFVGALLRT